MKNVVTFETAKRMKEAGFPQPAPEVGQAWYSLDFGLFLVGQQKLLISEQIWDCFYIEQEEVHQNLKSGFSLEFVFAPTAVDVLPELPEWFSVLAYGNGQFHLDIDTKNPKVTSRKNAAELLAKAWLEINAK